ncbi:MAG: serine/threonine protein kinase [Pseudomonadota bacterium]
MTSVERKLLKKDTFGTVYHCADGDDQWIERNIRAAAWWARPVARWLLGREARALGRLSAHGGFSRLRSVSRFDLARDYLDGAPMYAAKPHSVEYFRDARRQLKRLHRAGIAHNDLAKEPNWLVRADGSAAIIDFQLASLFRRRSARFRWQAREDIRHFLKHKRTYLPDCLTARERRILATPSPASRVYHATLKRAYLWLTRRVLHWSDREGAGDRGRID